MMSPCKNCADRYVGCHAKCDKYAVFRTEIEKINANKWSANSMVSYDVNRALKAREYRRKHKVDKK